MKETSKMYQRREVRKDFALYLHGHGIDVGCGDDPLCLPDITPGSVSRWDLPQGDAQYLHTIPDNSQDFLYSSHCLEHMENLPVALKNWTRVVHPGKILYLVVPDYTLYEHHEWPSRYNGDHKQSFSLTIERRKVNRPNHWDLSSLYPVFTSLTLKLMSVQLEDYGYDYNRGGSHVDQTLGDAVAQICYILQRSPS